jgi:hypothetical protein
MRKYQPGRDGQSSVSEWVQRKPTLRPNQFSPSDLNPLVKARLISRWAITLFGLLLLGRAALACDLCAISSAGSARGESTAGFLFTLSEQFVASDTEQRNGVEHKPGPGEDHYWYDKSITHLVPGYNFSERVGISLNVPIIYEEFNRLYLRYNNSGLLIPTTERGREFGLGDMSLIGRVTVFNKAEMEWGIGVNVLAGARFPTGNSDRLEDQADEARGHPPHVAVSGVHQSDLTLGSGSYDGIFGLTVNGRWQRLFCNVLAQYYVRTEGESTYTYANEVMVNGGPGYYLLLHKRYTLNLQAYAGYESRGRDTLFGAPVYDTGMTGWYMGPQIGFTWGLHFSAQAAVDLPIVIYNHGTQNVPDYRIHGGLTWRF